MTAITAFKNEMLVEHLSPQPHSQLKNAFCAHILISFYLVSRSDFQVLIPSRLWLVLVTFAKLDCHRTVDSEQAVFENTYDFKHKGESLKCQRVKSIVPITAKLQIFQAQTGRKPINILNIFKYYMIFA